jgi:hypothetical protein
LKAVSASAITNIGIGLAVLAFVLYRQLQPRPVRDNMRLPLILGVVELVQYLQHRPHGTGVIAALAGSLVIAAIFGATFTIQRMILLARAQRIGPGDTAGPRNTGAPNPSAPSW